MTDPEAAIHRAPAEIWITIIEDIIYESVQPYITFVPDAKKSPTGFWFTYVNHEFQIDSERKSDNIPVPRDYYTLRSVSRSWKAIADSLAHLFRARVLRGSDVTQYGGEGEVGRLHATSHDYQGQPGTQANWRSNLEANPQVYYIRLDDPINYSDAVREYYFDGLLSFAGSLQSLRCLELRTDSRGLGIMFNISAHLPRLITLDIRIQFTEHETSITDLENLDLPQLEVLRIDTDRWTLYEYAIRGWNLPNLRAVNLAANGGCFDDSNPSAKMIRDFFMMFGSKLAHVCCFICVTPVEDPGLHIAWESLPNLREFVTHPAVQFRGPAPKGSMLERVVVMERTEESKRWVSEMLDPAFAKQPIGDKSDPIVGGKETKSPDLTICLGYARWPKDGYGPNVNGAWYEQGQDLALFCGARGWKLEDGRGKCWDPSWNELNLGLPTISRNSSDGDT